MLNLKYSNHIQHYQKDAEFQDYFKNNPIEDHNIKRRYAYLFHWLHPNDKMSILEIGSGGGYAVEHIKKIKCSYIPLDIPVSSLSEIKSRDDTIIYPVSGDAYKLPFKKKSFNSVILSEVLEHIQDPVSVLTEISRILTTNGLLLISVPYKEKITYQICVHCNQPTPTHAHFHSFDANTLQAFIQDTGLKIERQATISNRLLSRISMFLKINYLPFGLWKVLDRLMNIVIPKPTHIMFKLRKY